jgi:bifunctional UDP-N-acetylglucosamine pyrophosphorylase/glucosamine-1-phosphate N-acetyltransferase
MPLSVVILAAGQGKRMKSDLPKVLQPLAGQPLLQHVINTARELNPAHIHVVYGHGGVQVQQVFAHEDVDWVLQAEQLGTGHATMQAMCVIPDDHTVLVLFGDVPLIRSGCLAKLVAAANEGALALLTVNLDEAAGYGRIVRDANGRVTSIVEHKDASPEQLTIREANSGLMAAPAGRLREWLLGLGSNNAQREYYLTDVVAGAVKSGDMVTPVPVATALEVLGVNDKIQLAQVESGHRRLRTEELMLAGATLIDPSRVDIRGRVTVDSDVTIDVNAVLIGKVHWARAYTLDPTA